jgi:hypothetical protein
MTTYPSTYFDGVTGLLEQLTLAVVSQKLINRSYLPDNLQTDFVSKSVDYRVVVDNSESYGEAYLQIDVTLPTIPYDARVLATADTDITTRALSLNAQSVASLGLSRENSYLGRSFPAKCPAYLEDFTSANHLITNTLERRIYSLCIQILAYKRWELAYNRIAEMMVVRDRIDALGLLAPTPLNLPSAAGLEDMRQALIGELATTDALTLRGIQEPFILRTANIGAGTGGGGGSAQELGNFFGGDDPASSDRLSSSLLNLLESTGAASPFGAPSDGGSPKQNESPILKDC